MGAKQSQPTVVFIKKQKNYFISLFIAVVLMALGGALFDYTQNTTSCTNNGMVSNNDAQILSGFLLAIGALYFIYAFLMLTFLRRYA